MSEFANKRYAVTGAASGIGREIALQLALEGAHVYLLDVDADGLAEVVRDAQVCGVDAVGITLSAAQHELATRRVEAAGLSKRIEIRIQDYRVLQEVFNQIDRSRSYQTFPSITVDRYPSPTGETEVILSSREVAEADIPAGSFILLTDLSSCYLLFVSFFFLFFFFLPPFPLRTLRPLRPLRLSTLLN